MNKSQLVDAIASGAGISKADAGAALDTLLKTVEGAVRKGERVSVPGFGTFERRSRAARTARNPRTGAAIKVKAAKVPAFRPGQEFKDIVDGKKPAPKAAAAKPAAAKAPARKPAAKAPARKPAAKAPARKPAAAKKPAAKKAPARKPAAKKR